MYRKAIDMAVARFFGKNRLLPEGIPRAYLLGLITENFLGVMRSLKLCMHPNLSPGRIVLGKSVRIRCKSLVSIGRGSRLGDGVYLDGFSIDGLELGENVSVGAQSRLICSGTIYAPGRGIRIGNRVGIGEFSRIGGSGGVEIGDDTIIGQYFSVHPENHQYEDKTKLIRNQPTLRAAIKIGGNCWFGAKVSVLSGVTIGEGVVIGTGSVVTKSIPRFSVAAAVPCKVLRTY